MDTQSFAGITKDGRTVRILQGEFTTSRELSYFKEVQGIYCKYSRGVKISGGIESLIQARQGRWITCEITYWDFVRGRFEGWEMGIVKL
jgi:hypothetical protein